MDVNVLSDTLNFLRDTNWTNLHVDDSSSSHLIHGKQLVRPYVWAMSLFCASLVGLTGVLPMLLIPHLDSSSKKMRLMLAFAVGGLLGDVFLHLLPEAWSKSHSLADNLSLGLWVVAGLFTFTSLEVFFASKEDTSQVESSKVAPAAKKEHAARASQESKINFCPVTGYLNVIANAIDNFTHGLAVAGSFIAGFKIGVLTTLAIVVHEVPHEFGDFAILMKSGFSKWQAAKAQISTASIGLLGAMTALMVDSFDSIGSKTSWILPFTAGGFLHIAMVSILPDIIREDNPVESIKQLIAVASGIAIMAVVNFFAH